MLLSDLGTSKGPPLPFLRWERAALSVWRQIKDMGWVTWGLQSLLPEEGGCGEELLRLLGVW